MHPLTVFLATSEYTASVIGAMSALFAAGAGIGAIIQGVRIFSEHQTTRSFPFSQDIIPG
jgi:hypothetical protein